jgi:endonuclease/exonuclease/phosphatase family metal-dependent hydrolase
MNKLLSFKYLLLLICMAFFTLGCSKDNPEVEPEEEEEEGHTLEIMSYNIRGDKPSDGVNQWEYRKERVADLIKKYNPALMGLQEARPPQLAYLQEQLDDYRTIGGGSVAGEYTVILYNTKMVEYVQGSSKTLYLSETPEEQSKGWDAEHIRVLIYATFRDLETGDEFLMMNTHFDHIGETARAESAKLVIATIKEIAEGKPVILTGDFNHTEGTVPYHLLTSPDSGLKNAFYESETPHEGPLTRSSGFSVANHSDKKPIDFIFINDKVRVLAHAFLRDSHNGYYPSDHLPVLAKIQFK